MVHVGLAGLVAVPVALIWRRRARWQAWELLIFVVPYSVWILWHFYGHKSKGFANYQLECCILGAMIAIATVIRVAYGDRRYRAFLSVFLIALTCAAVTTAYLILPPLSEY
jgi:hypothetical protein